MTMPYSNDIEQIRNGLMSYIGSIQEVLPFEGKAKNQIVAGILMDEVLGVSQTDETKYCDPYILVPMFKGVIGFLKQQQSVLAQKPTPENKDRIIVYQEIINVFDTLIKENMPETKS